MNNIIIWCSILPHIPPDEVKCLVFDQVYQISCPRTLKLSLSPSVYKLLADECKIYWGEVPDCTILTRFGDSLRAFVIMIKPQGYTGQYFKKTIRGNKLARLNTVGLNGGIGNMSHFSCASKSC